ncbi:MAG: alpha/beta hydrolase [Alphaproteobacteria bacterium]|nr:alpha/beta hydrolase [Alphaproteobacteria bacterium]
MFFTLLIIVIAVYMLIMLTMFAFQRKLMYVPETTILEPLHYGIENVSVLPLISEDKTAIEAWHIAASDSHPLIVYYHGNAGHIGDRMAKISHFVAAGFGVLAVSYRGYGNSKGLPSEAGLYSDARTTLNHAIKEFNVPPARILLYGESLGTGIATQMAKEMADANTPVAGLILEAPYTSVARRSQEMYPFLPAYYLAKDKYHTIDKIGDIQCPLMIFHGEKDTVIPVHHGRELFAKASEPKVVHYFESVDHSSFDYPTLAQHIVDFANAHGLVVTSE